MNSLEPLRSQGEVDSVLAAGGDADRRCARPAFPRLSVPSSRVTALPTGGATTPGSGDPSGDRRLSPAGRPRRQAGPASSGTRGRRAPPRPALPAPSARSVGSPPDGKAKSTETFFSRSGSSRAIRWASFLPIPGTRVKAEASSRAHAARTPGTDEDRKHRHGGLRSHAAHADRRQEDLALRVRGETEQVGAALPEMEMRAEDATLPVGGEVLAGGVGDMCAESDPGALQHHEILPAPGEAPSKMVDHRAYDSTTRRLPREAESVATSRG